MACTILLHQPNDANKASKLRLSSSTDKQDSACMFTSQILSAQGCGFNTTSQLAHHSRPPTPPWICIARSTTRGVLQSEFGFHFYVIGCDRKGVSMTFCFCPILSLQTLSDSYDLLYSGEKLQSPDFICVDSNVRDWT